MLWFRIDNRLVHGQVIEAWMPYVGASILVVANDDLATDPLRQEIMRLAIPDDVTFLCCRVTELASVLESLHTQAADPHIMVLFATCPDAQLAYTSGCRIHSVNIGNLHDGPGKQQLCAHVCVSEEDRSCLLFFHDHGVELDFRCVPGKSVTVHL
jgi:PTS system mannose-specific IIB component